MAQSYDVIIVGGGLIGRAIAASLLSKQNCKNLKVALIDACETIPSVLKDSFDSKVVALTHSSKVFLESIGAWREIQSQRVCPYYEMKVWDGDGTAEVAFNCDDVHAGQLGHIIENAVLVSALEQCISKKQGSESAAQYDVFQNCEVASFTSAEKQGEMPSILLSTQRSLQAKLIIGADGANSFVRKQANISTRSWAYGHTAIVATLETSESHNYTAWQRFTSTGPIAFLPLKSQNDKHFCSLVWSVETEKAEALMALSEAEFCTQLSREFECRLGHVLQAQNRFAVKLGQSHAISYFKSTVALVGDAAHTIHPLAGLGANMGLADATALTHEIDRACKRGLSLSDESILRRYERQRLGENLAVMAAMEGFKRLFGHDNIAVRFARNAGLKVFDQSAVLKKALTKWMCS